MVEERMIDCNGIRLHVVMMGPAEGPPVLTLHGFPETWRCWRHQIESLAGAGYRVIAPDQRGYHLSDKPRGVRHYRIETLVADMVGLLDALGYDQAEVIGHDWGAVVALHLAERFPARVKHLVISNGQHLHLMSQALLRHPRQLFKSWYVFFFQLPVLPEFLLRQALPKLFFHNDRRQFSTEDTVEYQQAWRKPGALTSMLNWYRAAYRHGMGELLGGLIRLRPLSHIYPPPEFTMPVLILWGVQDVALTKGLAQRLADACRHVEIAYFADASHWLPADKPEEVSQRILEFVSYSIPIK